METHEVILEIPLEHERNLFGGLDCHVKKIERTLRISVILRDGAVKLVGSESAVEQAKNVFSELLTLSERGNTITEQNVDYVLALSKEHSDVSLAEIDKELIGYTIQGKPIKPKTRGQQKYVNQIREKMMVFGIGPAGTGKTYLAMARDVITDAGYGKYFGHALGHSVGLEIHESPNFSPREETVIKPGMVITVEPGIYIEGIGGVRIEDVVIITEDGCENITHSTKKLLELTAQKG